MVNHAQIIITEPNEKEIAQPSTLFGFLMMKVQFRTFFPHLSSQAIKSYIKKKQF
jgi:hypothetical protein